MNQDEYPVDEETIHILFNATAAAENQVTQHQPPSPIDQDLPAPQPRRISTQTIRNSYQDEALQTESAIDHQTRRTHRRTLQLYEAQLRVNKSQTEHIEYLQSRIGLLETTNYQVTQEHARQTQSIAELQHQNACLQNQLATSTIFLQPLHLTANSQTMPGQNPAMMNTPQQNKTLRRQRNRHRRKDNIRMMEALVAENEPSHSSPLIVMTTPSPTLPNSHTGEQTTHTHPLDSSPPYSNQYETNTQIFRQSSNLKEELMSRMALFACQMLVFSLVVILLAYIYAMLR